MKAFRPTPQALESLKQRALSEWLLLQAQQGDREALEKLLRLWHGRYLLYARNRLGDTEAAKDVVQEGLMSITRALGALQDPAAFPGWSFRILERRCADWHRRHYRERDVLSFSDDLPEAGAGDKTETHRNVEELLGKLDSQLASTLRLYYLEDLSIAEIASVFRVPAGTIKSRLFYGRKLLRSILAQDE